MLIFKKLIIKFKYTEKWCLKVAVKKDHYVIELDNVWKIYKMGEAEVNALRGLTLKVKHGEFVAIMGPSGSGKSTAMNLVGCLALPTKGDSYLAGKNIAKLSESSRAQIRGRKIGFVFQSFNLIQTLTAMENVTLPMIFQGIPEEKRKGIAKSLLEMVGLGDRLKHKPTELSGGQQQRVAIARALCNNPEVLLADEPTGNLDTKSGETIINFLKKLHNEQKKTIIIVTHDEYVAEHAEKIYYLRDGCIQKEKRGNKHGK
ncbi:ABC transporter ATP-binding protein [Candidatus Woesearchaeota archaeon]|nr:ABC transporter ATP-binding protein [Candidatus Woesearchaeota archaeon]